MAELQSPLVLRDFSKGVMRPSAISNAISPPNSVSLALNVAFDTILGSAVVRSGTTKVGNTVASGKTPLGLFEFVTGGQAINDLLAVFSGASNASVYYYDSSWHTSGLTTLNNTAKVRFCMLGNQVFLTNGSDAMKSSVDGNTWGTTNCITTDSVKPALLMTIKNRVIAGGDSSAGVSRSRVYFSSIVDPSTSPGTITWSTDTTTGNWIDINPDDGDDVTAFAQTSGLALAFKRNAMYRMDVINKTVDTDNVFPFGVPSQEAVVNCQGLVYFFTGRDIRVTNGGFPNQISRLGVQDFINAIPQSNWSTVSAGTDGYNVSFSIGNVTVPATGQEAVTYTNVVLKFSTLDSNWTVYYYSQAFQAFCQFTTSANGRKMIGADTSGNVQTIDLGTSDNGTPIYYELRTQQLEFGNRAHDKQISEDVAVFMNYGGSTKFQWRTVGQDDWKDTDLILNKRVNVLESFTADGNLFEFRIKGETDTSGSQRAPVFEGLQFESVNNNGMREF